MPKFNVHIYRETRFKFDGIEAANPEEAAKLAAEMHSDDSSEWEECNGDNIAALVDTVGDDDYSQSVTVDFEAGRLLRSAPGLLTACRMVIERWESGDLAEAARACAGAIEAAA